jgi:hypothetical protein
VEEADRRVERGVVELLQARGVAQAVAERDERVQFVGGRLSLAPHERERLAVLAQQGGPRLVIGIAHAPFEAHELLHVFGCANPIALVLDEHTRGFHLVGFLSIQARGVVFEHAQDVVHGGFHESAGQFEALLVLTVTGHLPHLRLAGEQVFARVDRRRVVAVVIEEVGGDVVLRQERDELRVHVHLAEEVEALDALDGERRLLARGLAGGCAIVIEVRAGRALVVRALQAQAVLVAAQATVREEVIRAFHGEGRRL